ncbi:MAG TPA: FlgD immunoglobulin-like domain containing protein, partial [Candidatus Udaeobacter sp.]|nr:FlgD immunoglobulin-like domain containing protein [Candidatus Udaeobacter sp.]
LTNSLPGGCQAPFVDSLYANAPLPCGCPSCGGPTNFSLMAGQQDTVSCYVTPSGGEGSGYATFIVRSTTNPTITRTLVLGAVSNGCDVLLMDDDGGQTVETFYEAATPGIFARGTWRRNVASASASDLGNFPFLVWFTGGATAGLDATDRTAVAGYLTGGGKLILSGQDIAFDLCDPASPNFSAANVTWYETNLKTRYVGNNSSSTSLTGVAGDPISNGLNVTIQGGSGANNQTDPDILTPLAGAGTVWTYGAGTNTAATRILGQGYRAVDMGFGFEAVASAADRQTIMERAFTWLAASPVGVPDQGAAAVPGGVAIAPARPNPFNPATLIAFQIAQAGAVELKIYDTQGHVVRVLTHGQLPAGRHEAFWDGRDADGRGVASGVYLAEVSVAGVGSDRTKLILVR